MDAAAPLTAVGAALRFMRAAALSYLTACDDEFMRS